MSNSIFSKISSNRKRKKLIDNPSAIREKETHICSNLKFTAAEAYKLLRTNLQFTLPGDKACRIVGITSALPGEGKSVTSINLSYVFAESGKKVLLIDADMRLPNIARQLDLPQTPGLSNLLAGINDVQSTVQPSGVQPNFTVLTAGDIPPNPSELLGSEQMAALLEKLTDGYDYIIIDLPPVNIVTDALTILSSVDGVITVVRQNYANRTALKRCMRQLSMQKEKFLGFVMVDAKESTKEYGKYSKYGYGKQQ